MSKKSIGASASQPRRPALLSRSKRLRRPSDAEIEALLALIGHDLAMDGVAR